MDGLIDGWGGFGWWVQAILELVHDLGANWKLVSDVLSSNSQIKVRNDVYWAVVALVRAVKMMQIETAVERSPCMVDEVRRTCRAIGCVVVSGVCGLRRGLHGWYILGQGIYRKPLQCKEKHKVLTERVGSEGLENTEDPSSSQLQASKVSATHLGVGGQ